MGDGDGTVLSHAGGRGGAAEVAGDGGSVALAIRVDQLHGGRGSDGSHAVAGDTAGRDTGRAGNQVSGGITALFMLLVDVIFLSCRFVLICDATSLRRSREHITFESRIHTHSHIKIKEKNHVRTEPLTPHSRSWPWKPGRRRLAVLPADTAEAPAKTATVWKRILTIVN